MVTARTVQSQVVRLVKAMLKPGEPLNGQIRRILRIHRPTNSNRRKHVLRLADSKAECMHQHALVRPDKFKILLVAAFKEIDPVERHVLRR